MKTKKPPKPKRGRPELPPGQLGRNVNTYLRAAELAILERIGGTAQEGIRELIRAASRTPAT